MVVLGAESYPQGFGQARPCDDGPMWSVGRQSVDAVQHGSHKEHGLEAHLGCVGVGLVLHSWSVLVVVWFVNVLLWCQFDGVFSSDLI